MGCIILEPLQHDIFCQLWLLLHAWSAAARLCGGETPTKGLELRTIGLSKAHIANTRLAKAVHGQLGLRSVFVFTCLQPDWHPVDISSCLWTKCLYYAITKLDARYKILVCTTVPVWIMTSTSYRLRHLGLMRSRGGVPHRHVCCT